MTKFLRLIILISLPFITTAVAVRLNALHWYPLWEYSKTDFPPDPYGMTFEERLRLAQRSIDFLNAPHDIRILSELKLNDGSTAFNERELSHMEDVKRTFDALSWIGAGALGLLVLAVILLARRAGSAEAWGAVSDGGLVTLVGLMGVAAFMLLAWESFFVKFHELLFPPDTWMFYYSDTLIRLFPERFWQDVGLVISGLVFIQALGLALGGRMIQRCLTRSSGYDISDTGG